LPTAGTLFPLECIAELYHTSSSFWLTLLWRVRHIPPTGPCALSMSGSLVRLRQDRLGDVLALGTVRICIDARIEHRGKADHQVHPGDAGGKCLEGSEASRRGSLLLPTQLCSTRGGASSIYAVQKPSAAVGAPVKLGHSGRR
jgi:hypothetical protein